jgi:tetratricopeptide (TPR) repeat protein
LKRARCVGFVVLMITGLCACQVRAQVPGAPQSVVRSRLHLATELQRERRFEEALALFREIYESDPTDPRVSRGLKECLLELKLHDELAVILERELARNPDDPALLSELGTVAAQRGEREEAVRWWRRILEVQGGSAGAYSMVTELMKRSRMLDEALAVYVEAEAIHPGRFTQQKAELHELQFDFAQATAEYLRFLRERPTALSYVEGRLMRMGETENGLGPVIERVEQWLAAGGPRGLAASEDSEGEPAPGDLVFRKLLGDLYLEAGDHERAGEHYFRIADEVPGQIGSLLAFGKRCQTDGKHAAAIRVFEHLVERPGDARLVPAALTEIARSHAALRHWDAALVAYDRLATEFAETDYGLAAKLESGRILRDGRGDVEAAEPLFRQLVALGSGPWGEAEPQFEVAECAVRRGDLETAGGIYHAIGERPFSPATRERALYEEARIRFHRGELAGADSLFKRVALDHPEGRHVNDALEFSILINTNSGSDEAMAAYAEGLMFLRTLRPAQAVGALETLSTRFPGAAILDEALLLLGRAWREGGDPQRALAVLERAVAEAQVSDLAASARLLRARILAEDLGDRAAALAEYETLLVTYPETLAADRARDLAGDLKRVLP